METVKKIEKPAERLSIIDWLKSWAIIAVVLDHAEVLPEPYIVWSVNIFVLVTAALYSAPGYVFTAKKLAARLFYLAFIYFLAVLFFDLIFDAGYEKYNRAVLSVLEKPYNSLIANPYLGDIWYLSLHIQILLVMYLFLKIRDRVRPASVLVASVPIAMISFAATHFFLHRFYTILVSSWFLYLAVGFYFLIPFLQWIETKTKFRGRCILAAAMVLALIYFQYPLMPWLFTNENRSTFLMLPFYTVLIFMLGQLFYLSGTRPVLLKFKDAMIAIGKQTLAIYLAHEGFIKVWEPWVHSAWAVAALSFACSYAFGLFAGRIFDLLKIFYERCFVRSSARACPF